MQILTSMCYLWRVNMIASYEADQNYQTFTLYLSFYLSICSNSWSVGSISLMQLLWSRPSRSDREIGSTKGLPHEHLKVVKVCGYYGRSSDVELVRYFLENCVALEKLIIDPSYQQYLGRDLICPDEILDAERTARDYTKQQLQAHVPPHTELTILWILIILKMHHPIWFWWLYFCNACINNFWNILLALFIWKIHYLRYHQFLILTFFYKSKLLLSLLIQINLNFLSSILRSLQHTTNLKTSNITIHNHPTDASDRLYPT